jgi:hypothetical protein
VGRLPRRASQVLVGLGAVVWPELKRAGKGVVAVWQEDDCRVAAALFGSQRCESTNGVVVRVIAVYDENFWQG